MGEDLKIKLLEPGVVRVGKKQTKAGNWLGVRGSESNRKALDLRERKGWSHAAYTSSLYETPTTHYSFYNQYRSLMPEQYWQLYKSTPDVRACIDSIARRISTWDWFIKVNEDPRNPEEYTRLTDVAKRLRNFLKNPNTDGTTWQEMMTAMVTDLLVYDAGVIELVNDADGRLVELQTWLGSEWFPVTDEHGHLIRYDQQTEDTPEQPISVPPEDLCYFKLYTNNRATLGLPVLETVINECLTCVLASEHAMLSLDADEIPPGLLVLGGVAGQAAERARSDLMAMKGKDHRIRVVTSPQPGGIDAKWLELRHTPKDLEMQQVVEAMRKAIWRTFGVMPIELGESQGVPRATAEIQMDVASSHLISPILELIQARINTQVLPRLLDEFDEGQVSFLFDRAAPLTAQEKLDTAKRSEILLEHGVITVNEVRAEMGLMPVDGGDVPTVITALGPLPLAKVMQGLSPAETLPASQYADDNEEDSVALSATQIVQALLSGQKKNGKAVGHSCGVDHKHDHDCGKLYRKYEGIDFSVPKGVISELKKGIKWHEEGHSGGGLKPETVSWATRMVNGADISPEKVRKMRAWLARHEVDKEGKGFYPDQEGFPSPGRVAWALWGGDPAKPWSNKLVKQMEKEDKSGRSVGLDAEWLPSHWADPEVFKNVRTVNLKELASNVEDYTKGCNELYIETVREVQAILGSELASGGGRLTVRGTDRAIERVNKAFDDLIVKWSALTLPYYVNVSQMAFKSCAEWMGMQPNGSPTQVAMAYHNDAMLYLTDSIGLVGTLRENVNSIIRAATLSQRARVDEVYPEMDPEELIDIIDSEFSAQSHRVTNWSGKLVGLAWLAVGGYLLSKTVFVNGTANVWYYEWVAEGGRNCPTCAVEGSQGIRPLSEISIYPAEGTQCGANCRCVLTLWTQAEVDRGDVVLLSHLNED